MQWSGAYATIPVPGVGQPFQAADAQIEEGREVWDIPDGGKRTGGLARPRGRDHVVVDADRTTAIVRQLRFPS
jgi:hypothetical protein